MLIMTGKVMYRGRNWNRCTHVQYCLDVQYCSRVQSSLQYISDIRVYVRCAVHSAIVDYSCLRDLVIIEVSDNIACISASYVNEVIDALE